MNDEEKIDKLLRMIYKKYSYIKGYCIESRIYMESKPKTETVITIFTEGSYKILELENLMNRLRSIFNSKYNFDFMDAYKSDGFPFFDTANIIWFDDIF